MYGQPFKSISEIDVQKFDTAIDIPLFSPIYGTDPLPTHKGIWNTSTNSMASIVCSHYNIVQHRDLFTNLITSLKEIGLDGPGVLHNDGNSCKIAVFFKDIPVVRDDATGIKLGARFFNSYNKSSGIGIEGYALRIFCENQMLIRNIIPKMNFRHIHTQKNLEALASDSIMKFVNVLSDIVYPIEQAIETAQETEVRFKTEEEMIESMIRLTNFRIKIGTTIAESLLDNTGLTPTKWDIVNEFTAFASHDRAVGFNTAENLLYQADKILAPGYSVEMVGGVYPAG